MYSCRSEAQARRQDLDHRCRRHHQRVSKGSCSLSRERGRETVISLLSPLNSTIHDDPMCIPAATICFRWVLPPRDIENRYTRTSAPFQFADRVPFSGKTTQQGIGELRVRSRLTLTKQKLHTTLYYFSSRLVVPATRRDGDE